MKVAILTQYYPPEIGAPQARLSELANHFLRHGHEVFILTAMPNYPIGRFYPGYGGYFRKESAGGVSILRTIIYPTQSVSFFPRLLNYFSFVLSSLIFGTLFLPRLDCLITESPPLFLGISGFVLSRLKKARWIFNVSDLWPESALRLGAVRRGLALRLSYALEAFCYRRSWLVTGQSQEIVQDINRRFPKVRTYHLPNGVDTELFNPNKSSLEARLRLAKDTECIAIYAGLHGIAQGLGQILEVAQKLQNLTELRIIFVGDGPEKKSLIERSCSLGLNNVIFLDPVPKEEIPALLASADIALVTLKSALPGAVPSKIYEAMASGLAIILAAEGEAADIVRESQAGIVVTPGDIDSFARVLRGLVSDKRRRSQLKENGRKAVLRFNREKIFLEFINFCRLRF
jgi:glycosyltransferase involved in cell wall biosynthesis